MNLYTRYSEYVLYVSYACMRPQLASPAESGISSWVWNDHHLSEIMHHTTEAIRQGDKPYMQHSPLLLRSMEQENKQTKEQTTVISIVASLKPCVASEQGKSTTVAWGWPSIERQGNPRAQKKSETTLNPTLNRPPCYHRPIAFVNFVCLSLVSAFVSISATFSFVFT